MNAMAAVGRPMPVMPLIAPDTRKAANAIKTIEGMSTGPDPLFGQVRQTVECRAKSWQETTGTSRAVLASRPMGLCKADLRLHGLCSVACQFKCVDRVVQRDTQVLFLVTAEEFGADRVRHLAADQVDLGVI